VGLGDKAELFPTQLSLGQRRRVAIVRAFARRPETLLMDEPFTSLDADSAQGMHDLLRGLLAERPTRLILVTHDPRDAEALATRRIHLDGTPARIVDQSAVRN
jgi:NitT/TauT family transport system ATP-binding protein